MKISTENKIINFSKFLTIIGICGIIYLLNSMLLGINTLNSIQYDQRTIQAETRNASVSMECNALNSNDELAYYKCMNYPQ